MSMSQRSVWSLQCTPENKDRKALWTHAFSQITIPHLLFWIPSPLLHVKCVLCAWWVLVCVCGYTCMHHDVSAWITLHLKGSLVSVAVLFLWKFPVSASQVLGLRAGRLVHPDSVSSVLGLELSHDPSTFCCYYLTVLYKELLRLFQVNSFLCCCCCQVWQRIGQTCGAYCKANFTIERQSQPLSQYFGSVSSSWSYTIAVSYVKLPVSNDINMEIWSINTVVSFEKT